ncbi:helix-turn-helix domain-containing protein [Rubrivirga sp.]|uniref:helix-turn-helix domain-containing protein n=1 Tax=Rubrivirga sp. TaxID=1885344 RepID=UPI003B516C4D
MPSGPFEADLRAAREARGLSLSDIQQQTRIPVDVLRRFEEGDLVGDPTYNEVYLKAFLQSYGKAVGVAPSAITAAYAAQKAGSYDGALHPDFDPASAPARASPSGPATTARRPAPSDAEPADPAPADAERPAAEPGPPAAASGPAPAVQALRNTPPPEARPAEPERPTAPARVNRPAVPTARRSFDKNWTTILALFGAVVVALALAFYFLIFAGDSPDDDAPDTIAVGAAGEEVAIDSSGIGAGAAAGPRLQLPIRAVVTAGGDGLQSFRVTQDAGDRRPYWIDQGASETFEADSVLVLWGEDPGSDFSEATVEIQGLRFTPRSGRALRLDRQSGQAVLDSLAAADAAGPAPEVGAAPPAQDPAAFE